MLAMMKKHLNLKDLTAFTSIGEAELRLANRLALVI
jgi:hypothetical protein